MTTDQRFLGAGRVSYTLLDLLSQDPGRLPVRIRLFMTMMGNCDTRGRLKSGITDVAAQLVVKANNTQVYEAVGWLLENDWVRRQKGKYWINPQLYWKGRLDRNLATWHMAMRDYNTLPKGK